MQYELKNIGNCKLFKEYTELGWISPSISSFGALVIFSSKKDGILLMCINYGSLNKKIKLDAYPIPRIDKNLD